MKTKAKSRIPKKTAQAVIRALVSNVGTYPGTRIAASDCEATVTNALGQELCVSLTGFTVNVVGNPGTRLEFQIGHLTNRQVRANITGHWDFWAKFILAGHCASIPKEKAIEAITRLKIEAAEADRFEDAFNYLKQIRQLQTKMAEEALWFKRRRNL